MSRVERDDASIVLAMDTSGDVCSVAVLRDGRLCSEHTFRHEMHLSEHLMEHVDAVLDEANCALADVALFAVGIGPGSFTGTRIGVMTLKTVAVVFGRPVYGIDGLEAMAMEYAGTNRLIVPMLPCRAGTVYAAIYAVGESDLTVVTAPAALTISGLIETLPMDSHERAVFCGEAVDRYRGQLAEYAAMNTIGLGRVRFPRAAVIGEIAWRRRLAGDPAQDALALVPLYISPPPISTPKTPFPVAESRDRARSLTGE